MPTKVRQCLVGEYVDNESVVFVIGYRVIVGVRFNVLQELILIPLKLGILLQLKE
jgi:hypothetical protein